MSDDGDFRVVCVVYVTTENQWEVHKSVESINHCWFFGAVSILRAPEVGVTWILRVRFSPLDGGVISLSSGVNHIAVC